MLLIGNVLLLPFYYGLYYLLNSRYLDLKKHLVFKYLVDEKYEKLYDRVIINGPDK